MEGGGENMKVSLTLDDFPMALLDSFKTELAKHVEACVQVGGEDTVFVSFNTNNVSRAQCGIIIADKYHFAKGGGSDGEPI